MSYDLKKLVSRSDDCHPLKCASEDYFAGFEQAIKSVYHAGEVDDLLRRLVLGVQATFCEKRYYETAVELSVQNSLSHLESFEPSKRMNLNNHKDVDAFVVHRGINVSVEVKCVHQERDPTGEKVIVVKSAGRLLQPEQLVKFQGSLKEDLSSPVKVGKNRDHRIKEHLISAHDKFSPSSSVSDLNILFIACGDYHDMKEVWGHLFDNQGLFQRNSFCDPTCFRLVDVVILSSARYRHEKVRSKSDWKLRSCLNIPFVNPHGRTTLLPSTISNGLGAFTHCKREYDAFESTDASLPGFIRNSLKIPFFVCEGLGEQRRRELFPTISFHD